MIKNMTLLTFVETFPELEDEIRLYDTLAGTCLLCTSLFDTLEGLEISKNVDFSKLIKAAQELENNKYV